MGKDDLLKIKILIADIILIAATVTLTYSGAQYINPSWTNGFNNLPKLLLLYVTCLLACNAIYPSIIHNRVVRIEAIIQRALGVSIMLLLFVSVFMGFIKSNAHFPRTYTVATVGLFAIFYILERIIISKVLKSVRRSRRDLKDIVFIGKDKTITNLFHTLSVPHYGYNVKAVFYDGNCDDEEYKALYAGQTNDIYSYLATNSDLKEIYGSFPNEDQDQINMLAKYCDNHLIRLYYVPTINVFAGNLSFSSIEGIPIVARREEPLADPINKFIKRTFDLVFSTLFLLFVFPWIFLIVGLIIKRKSPGPIFFTQERTGLDGKIFKCIKFRTMKVNDQSDTIQATEDDPRKYPFGDFMRRTNIDELPQFINVWMGDMSVVGPRPHMLKHTEEYSKIINKFMVRHLAKPGITGWAQVSGFRGETRYIEQMEGRVRFDIEYIENWTFLFDLKIIFKTITNMCGGEKNAY